MATEMTKGEYRVGLPFNPSDKELVGRIKRAAADLIDLIESVPEPLTDEWAEDAAWLQIAEIRRCKETAATQVEAACMWAVKAATKPPVGE